MAKRAPTTRTQKPAPKRAAAKAPPSKAPAPKAPPSKAAKPRRPKAAPPPAPAIEAAPEIEPAALVPLSMPEVEFASRAPPPEPEAPRPTHRRAVFFDVENTSRARDVLRMLEHLAIDRVGTKTEFVASGNWRVVGSETARLLAQHGAHLVHSAPATGVRDWSDLRIAVAAGVWLASARPGDQVDIVSDDRAFDAVGDVAASLGVRFRRLSYRKLATGKQEAPAAAPAPAAPARATGRTRGGRGGRARGAPRAGKPAAPTPAPERVPAPEVVSAAAPAPVTAEAQAAPQDELLGLVKEMLAESPSGVSMDAVANRLRTRGFQRPPGSPRLVTRLRAFDALDVSPRGLIKLKGEAPAAEEPVVEGEPAEGAPEAAKRRRRRGGRGRRRPSGGNGAPPPAAE